MCVLPFKKKQKQKTHTRATVNIEENTFLKCHQSSMFELVTGGVRRVSVTETPTETPIQTASVLQTIKMQEAEGSYHSPRASKQRILPRMSSGSSLFMSIFLSYATRASSHSCSFSYQVAWISQWSKKNKAEETELCKNCGTHYNRVSRYLQVCRKIV